MTMDRLEALLQKAKSIHLTPADWHAGNQDADLPYYQRARIKAHLSICHPCRRLWQQRHGAHSNAEEAVLPLLQDLLPANIGHSHGELTQNTQSDKSLCN